MEGNYSLAKYYQQKEGRKPTYMSQAMKSKGARYVKKMKSRSELAPSMARTGGYSFSSVGGKELNFVDTAIAVAAVGNNDALNQNILLNGLAQGTSASQRVGRTVTMKSIELRLNHYSSNLHVTKNLSRYVIVLDKQPNAVLGRWADVYEGLGGITLPQDLRRISNKQRFWVLWDSGYVSLIGNSAKYPAPLADDVTVTDKTETYTTMYKRINIPVQYNIGTDATIGSIQKNSLLFMCCSDDPAVASIAPSVYGNIRVRYTD